jgi:hypothetical protein
MSTDLSLGLRESGRDVGQRPSPDRDSVCCVLFLEV